MMQRVATTLLSISFLGAFPVAASAAMPAGDAQCSALAAKAVGDSKVELAEAVTSGSFQPAEGPSLTGLPVFCHVRGVAKPTPRSNIHFEVWLPMTNWNGRVQMIGN